MFTSVLFSSLVLAPACLAQSYSLTDSYIPSNFFSKFDFFTGADPTHGYVDYVDYNTALSTGLIPSAGTAAWGVDNTTVLPSTNTAGRASVRLSSKATYNHGLFIADFAHMPDSTCSLWVRFSPDLFMSSHQANDYTACILAPRPNRHLAQQRRVGHY